MSSKALRLQRRRVNDVAHIDARRPPGQRSSARSRLPREIWSHIFAIGLPIPSPSNITDIRSAVRQYQVTLCSVCSAWRSVAVSAPRLWRVIIAGSYDPKDDLEDDMLKQLDERTKGVSIYLVVEWRQADLSVVQKLMKRAACLFLNVYTVMEEFLDLNAPVTPRLRTLYYNGSESITSLSNMSHAVSPVSADHGLELEELVILGTPASRILWNLQHLPRSLRRLSIGDPRVLTVRDEDIPSTIARVVPKLDYLRLDGLRARHRSIHFPSNLRVLHLGIDCCFDQIRPFWLPPTILHLSVQLNPYEMNDNWPGDINFSSLPKLRTLTLAIPQSGAEDFMYDLLRRTPNIRALELSWKRLYDLLGNLDPPGAGKLSTPEGALLPHLKLLRIHLCRYELGTEISSIHWKPPKFTYGYGDSEEEDDDEDEDEDEDDNPPGPDFDSFWNRMITFANQQRKLPEDQRIALEWWFTDEDDSLNLHPELDHADAYDILELFERRLEQFHPPGGGSWYRIGTHPNWWNIKEKRDWTSEDLDRESCRHFVPEVPELSTLEWTEL